MLRNFSYIVKDRVAGAARPGSWCDLEDDLEEARQQGITAVVSLTEEPLDARTVRRSGLDYLHEPIDDFGAPTLTQLHRIVEFIRSHVAQGKGGVLVHCFAGRGRTGCILAAYLVSTGMEAEDSLRTIRRMRPYSVESPEQEDILSVYQAYLEAMGRWKSTPKSEDDAIRKVAPEKETEEVDQPSESVKPAPTQKSIPTGKTTPEKKTPRKRKENAEERTKPRSNRPQKKSKSDSPPLPFCEKEFLDDLL